MELRERLLNLKKVTKQDGGEYVMMKSEVLLFLTEIRNGGEFASRIAETLMGIMPRFTWGFPEISEKQADILARRAAELGIDIPETRRMAMEENIIGTK